MTEPTTPTILLLGGTGQVGWELQRSLAACGAVIAPDRSTLDLTDRPAVRAVIRSLAPAIVVNAAAYTAVDQAESDIEGAVALNTALPQLLAEESARLGCLMIHYSTDYVFDGTAARAYREVDPPSPINVYGRTKLAGDKAILSSGARAIIFRVAWVYGMRGKNFLRTIQRLANEREELRVVADQWGTPTWSRAIADVTASAITSLDATGGRTGVHAEGGIFHLASSDTATWHEFAEAIVAGLVNETRPHVTAIASTEFPTPAQRPARAILDASLLRERCGLELRSWRVQLAACLADSVERRTEAPDTSYSGPTDPEGTSSARRRRRHR